VKKYRLALHRLLRKSGTRTPRRSAYLGRSGIIGMRGGHKTLKVAALTVGLVALLVSDDRAGGFSWSLSVPDLIAVCAIGMAVYLFIRHSEKDGRL
jgi:hypothetical protein